MFRTSTYAPRRNRVVGLLNPHLTSSRAVAGHSLPNPFPLSPYISRIFLISEIACRVLPLRSTRVLSSGEWRLLGTLKLGAKSYVLCHPKKYTLRAPSAHL